MSTTPQLVYVDNEGITDPHVNLAIEEYALRNLDPRYTYLLFYVNEPSIIIGRNQNTFEEINREYVEDHGIHVVRRLSGGGAVYHDSGNLNFSFITDYGSDRLHNFRLFTEPVARVLQSIGVAAEFQGRNDLVIAGRKVSGNAQFSTSRRMFSHGTLLFNSDLAEVGLALKPRMSKVQSKGHKSVRSRVANIAEFVNSEMDTPTFQRRLLDGIFRGDDIPVYRLTPQDWAGVRRLYEDRYARWDWNYGESPPFEMQRSHRFEFGEIDIRLDVRKGRIEQARLFGDFLGSRNVQPLEALLKGMPYDREALERSLCSVDPGSVIPGLSRKDLVDVVLGDLDDG